MLQGLKWIQMIWVCSDIRVFFMLWNWLGREHVLFGFCFDLVFTQAKRKFHSDFTQTSEYKSGRLKPLQCWTGTMPKLDKSASYEQVAQHQVFDELVRRTPPRRAGSAGAWATSASQDGSQAMKKPELVVIICVKSAVKRDKTQRRGRKYASPCITDSVQTVNLHVGASGCPEPLGQ